MMDFVINGEELAALSGLPHIQQLAYLRGIRPYMDVKIGIVGIKRRISYQSISEQLYIESYQGIKSQSFSRDQVRRAVAGLVRVGIIEVQSEGMQLILKCSLASRHFSVQNKAAINPPQKATINPPEKILVDKGLPEDEAQNADIAEPQKAAIPLIKENNYIYLLTQFEKFWDVYPEKKSRQLAWKAFELLNPDASVFAKMILAIHTQIQNRKEQQLNGAWIPAWKYPANWLAQRCWENEITEVTQEKNNEHNRADHQHEPAKDMFWNPSDEYCEPEINNVVQFQRSSS
jgi:hypothetical protein